MNWWVSYGDETIINHGTPNQSGWMTADEAVECARRQLQAGDRVIEIRGPSGEVWNEGRVLEIVGKISN